MWKPFRILYTLSLINKLFFSHEVFPLKETIHGVSFIESETIGIPKVTLNLSRESYFQWYLLYLFLLGPTQGIYK